MVDSEQAGWMNGSGRRRSRSGTERFNVHFLAQLPLYHAYPQNTVLIIRDFHSVQRKLQSVPEVKGGRERVEPRSLALPLHPLSEPFTAQHHVSMIDLGPGNLFSI
jgi:hypothetical protein